MQQQTAKPGFGTQLGMVSKEKKLRQKARAKERKAEARALGATAKASARPSHAPEAEAEAEEGATPAEPSSSSRLRRETWKAGLYKAERDALEHSVLMSEQRRQVAEGSSWALEIEAEATRDNMAQVEADRAKLEADLREAKNHIADLEKELADCRSKQAADAEELRSVRTQLEAVSTERDNLNGEKFKLTMTIASQKMLMEKGDERFSDLQRKHAAANAENLELRNNYRAMCAQATWAQQRLYRHAAEANLEQGALKSENDRLVSESVALKGKNIALEE